jgi:hypothetical protein
MTVEFLIHESLPDKSPTSVNRKRRLCRIRSCYLMPIPEVLCEQSGLGEILWNFSRSKDEKKRLRLRQHPQFYETLPTLPKEYGAEFRRDPTETFLVEKVCVLMDKRSSAGRVFLETARNKRAFGNAWIPNNAIIFKGSCLSNLYSPPSVLTFPQTFVESSRGKVSSVGPFGTHPTYGALRSLRDLPPFRRHFLQIGAALYILLPGRQHVLQKGHR